MKVLQITAFNGWGCTGRIAVGIYQKLVEKNHECTIAWGRINTAADNIKSIRIGNQVDQHLHGLYTRITDKCGFGSRKVTEDFIRWIDIYNPDIIQMHIIHGYYINLEALFTYIKKKNIPVVWTFHDCWAFTGHCPYFDMAKCEKWKKGCYSCKQKAHHPTSWLLDNSKWNWLKKKQLYGNYPLLTIVTPSEWLAELVKKSFLKNSEIQVINNGINLTKFKPTVGKYFDKYNIKGKKIILGVSSTWVKSKGIEDFIQLATKLDDSYQIVLVGLSKEQLSQLPKKIIGIARTDSVEELAQIYTSASVFVNPTYEDNYPTTNLEAIACGTPVVTYRTGGSVEIIQKTGAGLIVEQGNVSSLEKAIHLVMDNISIYQKMTHIDSAVLDENVKFDEYVSLYEKIIMRK